MAQAVYGFIIIYLLSQPLERAMRSLFLLRGFHCFLFYFFLEFVASFTLYLTSRLINCRSVTSVIEYYCFKTTFTDPDKIQESLPLSLDGFCQSVSRNRFKVSNMHISVCVKNMEDLPNRALQHRETVYYGKLQ